MRYKAFLNFWSRPKKQASQLTSVISQNKGLQQPVSCSWSKIDRSVCLSFTHTKSGKRRKNMGHNKSNNEKNIYLSLSNAPPTGIGGHNFPQLCTTLHNSPQLSVMCCLYELFWYPLSMPSYQSIKDFLS